jgi:hypothetical protein
MTEPALYSKRRIGCYTGAQIVWLFVIGYGGSVWGTTSNLQWFSQGPSPNLLIFGSPVTTSAEFVFACGIIVVDRLLNFVTRMFEAPYLKTNCNYAYPMVDQVVIEVARFIQLLYLYGSLLLRAHIAWQQMDLFVWLVFCEWINVLIIDRYQALCSMSQSCSKQPHNSAPNANQPVLPGMLESLVNRCVGEDATTDSKHNLLSQ